MRMGAPSMVLANNLNILSKETLVAPKCGEGVGLVYIHIIYILNLDDLLGLGLSTEIR